MMNPELEEFARIFVQHVRDEAIRSCDRILRPDAAHLVATRWRESFDKGDPIEIATTLIPDIVDDTLFFLLNAIDNDILKLSFTSESGKTIDLTSGGNHDDLGGWYAGGFWNKSYSKERTVENFPED